MCESGSTKVRAPLNESIYSLSTAKIIFIMLLLLHEKKLFQTQYITER